MSLSGCTALYGVVVRSVSRSTGEFVRSVRSGPSGRAQKLVRWACTVGFDPLSIVRRTQTPHHRPDLAESWAGTPQALVGLSPGRGHAPPRAAQTYVYRGRAPRTSHAQLLSAACPHPCPHGGLLGRHAPGATATHPLGRTVPCTLSTQLDTFRHMPHTGGTPVGNSPSGRHQRPERTGSVGPKGIGS